jgi:protein phosphatase PTC2/3
MIKPNTFTGQVWPKCSFFAIYDGHGGNLCADFLRDNLHDYIIKDPSFPKNPKEAIERGFETAEREFITNHSLNSMKTEIIDKSGSCAIVVLTVEDICYVANVGDSRAIISKSCGSIYKAITVDHKPNDQNETKRIIEAGGKIYQYYYITKDSDNAKKPI